MYTYKKANLTSACIAIPCGLVVRIRRSHRRGRGSIPRMGAQFFFFFFSFSHKHGRLFNTLGKLKQSLILFTRG